MREMLHLFSETSQLNAFFSWLFVQSRPSPNLNENGRGGEGAGSKKREGGENTLKITNEQRRTDFFYTSFSILLSVVNFNKNRRGGEEGRKDRKSGGGNKNYK